MQIVCQNQIACMSFTHPVLSGQLLAADIIYSVITLI